MESIADAFDPRLHLRNHFFNSHMVHVRQKENCTAADSTSDSSEKRLQRDVEWIGEGRSLYK